MFHRDICCRSNKTLGQFVSKPGQFVYFSKFIYSAAQIYPNYAYAYYTLVFCVYAYVYTRIRVCLYAYTRMAIRAYAYGNTRIRVWQYARICPFVMHSHKFLCMKHCWSNKGHMGMKRLQSEICILLKCHADQ